jgi:2-keto-4-pentenoate hydratase/2-oxohepta-3-ene-1,7-dioic acid hydratase in catechol pathway
MKFLRFMVDGRVLHGFIENQTVNEIDCNILTPPKNLEVLNSYQQDQVKILSPVKPSKVVCVGLNYRDHAHELGMDIPDEPIIFLKPPTSIIGHLEPIIYPPHTNELHYEVELAAIISKTAKNVNKSEASEYLAGYTILNDLTARDLQRKDVQWTRAKSFDTFCPIGPFVENNMDPQDQRISLDVNGDTKQESSTRNMIFSVVELVEFISSIMTLETGDLIATGTPPGVGVLEKGDVVEAIVEGIGTLKNMVK